MGFCKVFAVREVPGAGFGFLAERLVVTGRVLEIGFTSGLEVGLEAGFGTGFTATCGFFVALGVGLAGCGVGVGNVVAGATAFTAGGSGC